MDKRLMFERVVNPGNRILDRKHKAGGKLLQRTAGIHEGGRVRQKVQTRHELIKPLFGRVNFFRLRTVQRFRLGQIMGDAPEQTFRRLHDFSMFVLGQIAFL